MTWTPRGRRLARFLVRLRPSVGAGSWASISFCVRGARGIEIGGRRGLAVNLAPARFRGWGWPPGGSGGCRLLGGQSRPRRQGLPGGRPREYMRGAAVLASSDRGLASKPPALFLVAVFASVAG